MWTRARKWREKKINELALSVCFADTSPKGRGKGQPITSLAPPLGELAR